MLPKETPLTASAGIAIDQKGENAYKENNNEKNKGDLVVEAYTRLMQEWMERNPLRAWRRRNRVEVRAAAQALRVSTTTITNWESGVSAPSRANMDAIGIVTGDEQINKTWNAWLDERPAWPAGGSASSSDAGSMPAEGAG